MSDIDSNFFDRFPNWLRWVLLPVAVVAAYIIVTAVIGIILWITRSFIGATDSSWMAWGHYYVVQPGISCYATVLAGSYCAPSKKFVTSLILGILFTVLNGMGIMSMTALGFDFAMFTALIFGIIGAGTAVFQVKKETI